MARRLSGRFALQSAAPESGLEMRPAWGPTERRKAICGRPGREDAQAGLPASRARCRALAAERISSRRSRAASRPTFPDGGNGQPRMDANAGGWGPGRPLVVSIRVHWRAFVVRLRPLAPAPFAPCRSRRSFGAHGATVTAQCSTPAANCSRRGPTGSVHAVTPSATCEAIPGRSAAAWPAASGTSATVTRAGSLTVPT